MDENNINVENLLGKKVFFLHPHSVIRDELIAEIVAHEYEAYTLKDHNKALRILKHFPGSIIFINIDEGLKEPEWEAYIKSIQETPELAETRIGILSYNNDKELMQKYLFDLAIPCGYIQLKLGAEASTKIIIEALKANEAKGIRKFVRVNCEKEAQASMNYQADDKTLHGNIIDISSAGISCSFDHDPGLPANIYMKNIQLKLRGKLALVNGILMGSRSGDDNVYVILFDPKTDKRQKAHIQEFIKTALQKQIDNLRI